MQDAAAPVPSRPGPPLVRALKWIDDRFWGEVPQKRVRWLGYDTGIKPGEKACTVAGCTAQHDEAGKSAKVDGGNDRLLRAAEGEHEPLRQAGQGLMGVRLGPLTLPWPRTADGGRSVLGALSQAAAGRPAQRGDGDHPPGPRRARSSRPGPSCTRRKSRPATSRSWRSGSAPSWSGSSTWSSRARRSARAIRSAIVCAVRAEYDPRAAPGIGGQVPVQNGLFVTFILSAYIREMGYPSDGRAGPGRASGWPWRPAWDGSNAAWPAGRHRSSARGSTWPTSSAPTCRSRPTARSGPVPYVITEACTRDGACVEVCPVACIHTTPDAPQFYIDPDICIECEQCEVVCPVDAIYLDTSLAGPLATGDRD